MTDTDLPPEYDALVELLQNAIAAGDIDDVAEHAADLASVLTEWQLR